MGRPVYPDNKIYIFENITNRVFDIVFITLFASFNIVFKQMSVILQWLLHFPV